MRRPQEPGAPRNGATRDGNRLVVVGDAYYATLAAVRALRSAGYDVWLANTAEGSLAERSRAISGARRLVHPSRGTEQFIAELTSFARAVDADAILPGTEASLAALADRDVGIPTGAISAEQLRRATDKRSLGELVRESGLRSPESLLVHLPAGASEINLPAIVKPATSTVEVDGRTIGMPRGVRVDSVDDLRAAVERLPPGDYLVQSVITGPLAAVAGVAWEGRLVCMSQQVSVRIYPPRAGMSAFARTVPLDPELVDKVERLLERLRLSGVWEMQFIASEDGPQVIDFNPRFYGSLGLTVAAGLNLPAIWADLLLGRAPRVGAYRPGVRFRAEAREAHLLARSVRTRDIRTIAQIALPRARTAHAVLSVRDPLPFLRAAARLWARDGKSEETFE